MKNITNYAYISVIVITSISCMNSANSSNKLQQSTDSATLLKTVFIEAGTSDILLANVNSIIYGNYDARIARTLSEKEKQKMEEDHEKILQDWHEFKHAGYEFSSSSELPTSEDVSSKSTDSLASSAHITSKDSLEPIYTLVERKKLDLETKKQSQN